MALIAGMSEGEHEIVIADSSDVRLAALMEALQRTRGERRVESWLGSLNCECGNQMLEKRMRELFSNIQDAFQRLQQRALHHRFIFYRPDVSQEGNVDRILASKYSQEPFQAIYLGNIDNFLLADLLINDNNQIVLTKVEKKLRS